MAKYAYSWSGNIDAFEGVSGTRLTGSPPPAGQEVKSASVRIRIRVHTNGVDSQTTILVYNGSGYLYTASAMSPVSVEDDGYYRAILTFEEKLKTSEGSLTEWFSGQTSLVLDHIGTGLITGGIAELLEVTVTAETASSARVQFFDGENWLPCAVKMWNGNSWEDQSAKYYDGDRWL